MKRITITSMRLTNFKGIRSLQLDFYKSEMAVCGRNGLGKTTVFDAFTWLLFGKDSHDNKQFDIKTLDENGVAIPHIPHEVSAALDVDGERIELCRRFTEKWTKKRGEAEAVFAGHTEERLYNNVPCSVKEWNEKIANICPEQTFKYITNPKYFTAQKADVQRKMLFTMAGEVSDEEIAADNADFESLLDKLQGKTLDELKREVLAQKRRIKSEVETLPSRIDERQREISELSTEDFAEVEQQLADKQQQLQNVEAELLDISKQQQAVSERRAKQVEELGKLKEQRTALIADVKAKATEQYYNAKHERQRIELEVKQKQHAISEAKKQIESYAVQIDALNKKQEALRAEWYEVNGEVLEFGGEDFVCPTCKRPLDPAQADEKRKEMQANFNTNKAEKLTEIKRKGKALSDDIAAMKSIISDNGAGIDAAEKRIKELQSLDIMQGELTEPDVKKELFTNIQLLQLDELIEVTEKRLQAKYATDDTSTHTDRKAALTADIDTLKATLANKQVIDNNEKRIAELEKQLQEQNQQIADLERMEFTMQAFSKARVNAVENRINGMFRLVKFKMFEQQINGGEVETCEATVNGVPYSSLNTAMQIWAGIDIISAISQYEGINAPCFIDNAEACNTFPETEAQLIKLTVTTDDKLTIK